MNSHKHNRKLNIITSSLTLITLTTATFTNAAPPWEEADKLLATDGIEFDKFGTSVAVDGNIAVIGSPFVDGNGKGSDIGSVYVFDVTTGLQSFKLFACDGSFTNQFGRSVAISGSLAIAGSPFDIGSAGSVYVFDVTTGRQLVKLTASDGTVGDHFGTSVAITNNIALIGADSDDDQGASSGSAYVFDVTTRQQLFKLLPSDGAGGDLFGIDVAMSDQFLLIGASGDDDNGSGSGSAYVFDVTNGQQLFKLLPNDGEAGNKFGNSVALSGNLAVIGANFDADNGVRSGSVYVFDVTTGEQIFKLLPNDGAAFDEFGNSLALSGNLAVIGAKGDDDNGEASGSTYVFDVTTGLQLSKLLPADGASSDFFGDSVAISGNQVLIGAPADDDNGTDSGSAYVFQQTSSCLDLTVNNLVAGQNAIVTITRGTPGARAVTVYGTKAGQTIVNNISGYCAIFGIKGVSQSKVLGGLNQVFDANGKISFNQTIPGNAAGTVVFFQSAMQGTCPEECISNLVNMTVQ